MGQLFYEIFEGSIRFIVASSQQQQGSQHMLQLPYQADMRKRRNDGSEANSGSLHLWLISHKAYLAH